MSDLQSSSIRDIITDARSEILAEAGGFDPIPPNEFLLGLRIFNRLMGMWTTIRNYAWHERTDTYTFASSKQTYTIGPSNPSFTPDFVGPRPTRILRANIVDNVVSPVVFIPLRIVDYDQWASFRVLQILVTIPTVLWPDFGYTSVGTGSNSSTFPGVPNPGYANLNFWGEPTSGYGVILYTPEQLTNGLCTLDTNFTFPPGYEMAIIKTLAEYLAPSYGRSISPELQRQAREARAAIRNLNTKAHALNTDYPGGVSNRGYFNWLNGNFG